MFHFLQGHYFYWCVRLFRLLFQLQAGSKIVAKCYIQAFMRWTYKLFYCLNVILRAKVSWEKEKKKGFFDFLPINVWICNNLWFRQPVTDSCGGSGSSLSHVDLQDLAFFKSVVSPQRPSAQMQPSSRGAGLVPRPLEKQQQPLRWREGIWKQDPLHDVCEILAKENKQANGSKCKYFSKQALKSHCVNTAEYPHLNVRILILLVRRSQTFLQVCFRVQMTSTGLS